MKAFYLSVNWRFFAKSKQVDNYLIVIGKLCPDLTDFIPDEVLIGLLSEAAIKRIEKVEKFGGEICEEIPRLNEFTGKNPKIAFQVKFKTLEDLMKYRKEMF